MTTWSNPKLARRFPGPGTGSATPTEKQPAPWRSRSRFVDELPQFVVMRGYFASISVAAPTINTGEAAWFGLRRIIAGRDIAQEFSLTGVAMTLLPTDSAGGGLTGYTSPLAWGDTRGITAAMVVGKSLPIKEQDWTSAVAYLPGINFGLATQSAASKLSSASIREYDVEQSFPTGTFRDTAPNKPPLRWSFAPHVKRFRRGEALDIALVVRGDQINGQTGTLAGYASVAVTLGLSNSEADFKVE